MCIVRCSQNEKLCAHRHCQAQRRLRTADGIKRRAKGTRDGGVGAESESAQGCAAIQLEGNGKRGFEYKTR